MHPPQRLLAIAYAVALLALPATQLAVSPSAASPPPPAPPVVATAADSRVPVTVVLTPEQNGGTPDDLAQLAERTLGDQGRAEEVFELNEGRVQADGSVVTSPEAILPGWVLVLPDDARRGKFVALVSPDRVPAQAEDPEGGQDEQAGTDGQDGQDGGRVLATVVRAVDENDGVPDDLAQIAQRTLGDQNRAAEIFELNEGRVQADGSQLFDPAVLQPGWVLVLPDDAGGDDVLVAPTPEDGAAPGVELGEAAPGDDQAGDQTGDQPGEGEADQDGEAGSGDGGLLDRVPWSVVLTVLGGVLIALLTLAIMLRRTVRAWASRLRRAVARVRARLAERRRRQQALRLRSQLVAQWQGDLESGFLARAVSASLEDAVGGGPVALVVARESVTVLGVRDVELPAPWAAGPEAGSWTRPRAGIAAGQRPGAPVARVGGEDDEQLFVDASHCAGVLTVSGDPALALEVARALVTELGTAPGVQAYALGRTALSRVESLANAASLESHGLTLPEEDLGPPGLVRTTLTRTRLRGVVLAEPGVPSGELAAAASRCAAPGSGWLLVTVGDLPAAHWRLRVHPDGVLDVPFLARSVVAVGTADLAAPR